MPDSSPAPVSPYRWLMVVLGIVLAVLALFRLTSSDGPSVPGLTPVQKLSVVPPFALTERSGRQVSNRDLAGKIWIGDFIYTTCPGPCPIITTNMAKLQDLVAHDPRVMLISFTVDPLMDTPPVLAKYADDYHADPNRWWFLTGTEKQMFDLIFNGFHLEIEDNSGKPPEPGQYKVTHSTNLVLVDGDGTVRGYYNGVDDKGRTDLLRDIQLIEKENP